MRSTRPFVSCLPTLLVVMGVGCTTPGTPPRSMAGAMRVEPAQPLFGPPTAASCAAEERVQRIEAGGIETGLLSRLIDDQRNFYSGDSMFMLGGALAVGSVMANTQLGGEVQDHIQSSIENATSDEWYESLHAGKELGNGLYTIPVFGVCWVTGELFPESPTATTLGDWGERTTRGFAVGVPPMLALQTLLGGARPGETANGSQWTPLKDNNGVSGHSFMGSLPFLTAAKMSERRSCKAFFYAASAVAPLSRVNDNAHYPSQAALGWFVAYLAADAVSTTEHMGRPFRVTPYVNPDESGVVFDISY